MTDRIVDVLKKAGLGSLAPFVRLLALDDPLTQCKVIWSTLGVPAVAFVLFLAAWSAAAARIETSLGNVPGPVQVYAQIGSLWDEHQEQRTKEVAFYERQEKRNARKLEKNPDADVRIRSYTGKPTYLDQIGTSLYTVFAGFFIASLISVPIGILCGMNRFAMNALNPLIQLFKPVSPLAWLPIVTMIVSAVYTTNDGMFDKSFLNSAITVSLCSLWPALINTALGVGSLDKDYMNVARVLQLSFFTKVSKIVLPASLPLIFTGLRISLGVGWMVLIAAEMLAQNPGLGKFVWDEFQNGSSHSLARIMVAVLTIGVIGYGLDRTMVVLQKWVSFEDRPATA